MAYTIENNKPTAGSIRWSGLSMTYKGQTHTIQDGYTNNIYAYWTPDYPNNLVVTNTFPTLGDDDCLIFLNKNGVATTVPKATVLNGDLIVPGSITANAIAANTITGDEIMAGAIGANQIAVNAIGAEKIVAGAIIADKIASNAITVEKLASSVGVDLNISSNSSITSRVTSSDMDNAIATAKSANYGYKYATDIVMHGDSDKYYPVIIKAGDQNVKRDILVKRGYAEQAPSDWYSSTHKGALTLKLKGNFGGWGGATYDWEIHEFQEQYSRLFAGAVRCGNNVMFAIFLRGGGTNGAVYHLYSDQSLTSNIYHNGYIAPSPQICYNQDIIFHYEHTNGTTYKRYAPAYRSITESVEEELRKKNFIKMADVNDTRIYDAEQKITPTAITSTVRSSTEYINDLGEKVGESEIVSKINQTAESIKISASKVDIEGAVTFNSLESSMQTKVNNSEAAYTDTSNWKEPGKTTIDGGKIEADSITAAQVNAGSVAAEIATVISLDASKITTGTLEAGRVSASNITSGTLSASRIATGSLDATKITSGTITATQLSTGAVTADKILGNSITGDKIQAGSISADHLSVLSLESLNAILSQGGQSLNLKAGSTQDHVYLAFYADSQSQTTRSGWMGYGVPGSNALSVTNSVNGDLELRTNTGYAVTTNRDLNVGGYIRSQSITLGVNAPSPNDPLNVPGTLWYGNGYGGYGLYLRNQTGWTFVKG